MLLDAVVDLVLPRLCVGCGAPGIGLCRSCAEISVRVEVRGGLPVASAAAYEGATRRAVLAYKERGRRDLARPLVEMLILALRALPGGPVALIPIPSRRAVAAGRGGDHVARLARRAGPALGVRTATRALVLREDVRDSAGLSVGERAANLDHAMTGRPPPIPGLAAVLNDDVVTSGATLREARRALEAAGWAVTGAATVAATPLRRGAPIPSGTTCATGLTLF